MANPAIVQAPNTVVTTTSGPASITASLAGASTAGNLLLMWVAVGSSANNAAITTPAGWTLIGSQLSSSGARILSLFALPNNAGGITTVVVTITNTTGGAVATMMEVSGMGTNPPVEVNIGTTGTADGATIPLARQFPPPATVGALWLYALAYTDNPGYTPANAQGWSTQAQGTSTTGTQTVGLSSFYLLTLGPGTLQNGGILPNTNLFSMLVIRFAGTLGPIGYAQAGGVDPTASSGSPNMFGSWSVG